MRNNTYERDVEWYVGCLSQEIATLVRFTGPLHIVLIRMEIAELRSDLARALRTAETANGLRLVRAVRRARWLETQVNRLTRAAKRFGKPTSKPLSRNADRETDLKRDHQEG